MAQACPFADMMCFGLLRCHNVLLCWLRLSVQLYRQTGDMLALKAGDIQFFFRGLSRAVAAGVGRCAIRRAAAHLTNIEQLLRAVADGNDYHAVMGQRRPG